MAGEKYQPNGHLKILASIKLFKNLWQFCSYWDGKVKECLADNKGNNEYARQIIAKRENVVQRLKQRGQEGWFGVDCDGRIPKSWDDAMYRRTYQNIGIKPDGSLCLYDKVYLDIEPFLSSLEKISTGLIPKPVIVANNRQLGSFSLERAMMSPTKRICLWSNKHKREYTLAEGTQTGQTVKVKLNNEYINKKDIEVECPVFKLKDGSEAYLTQKLQRNLCLWSNIHKQEFDIDGGVPELDDEKDILYVKIKLNNSYKDKKDEAEQCALYKLADGTEAYLTDKVIEGELSRKALAWSSLNKKSFLYQEKLPKPNNNVRLFVIIGGNCDKEELHWGGMVALMAAKFLSAKGYAVRVTGVIARRNDAPGRYPSSEQMTFSWYDEDKTYHEKERFDGTGYRVNLIDMKGYDEEIDTLGLLYPLADASFFRIRTFDYFTAEYWLFKDYCSSGLGYSCKTHEVESIVRDKIKSREIEQEADVLYYFIGGDDVTSLEGARRNLAKIIYCAEKTNKESLIKLGHSFEVESDPIINKEFEELVEQYNLAGIICNNPD